MYRAVSACTTRTIYRASFAKATQRRAAMFSAVKPGPPDPMYLVKKACDEDTDSRKVDLGVGIYRNEAGLYNELDCLKQVGAVILELRGRLTWGRPK